MISITFEAHELKSKVTAFLSGPVVPIVHDGEGWQAVQRFGRSSFTEWQGGQQLELQIPLIFDGKQRQHSQEAGIGRLEKMCQKMAKKDRTPLLTLDAKGACPHDKTRNPHIIWVATTLDQSTGYELDIFRRYRVRAEMTLNVWQYSPDHIFQSKGRLPNKQVPKKYKIRANDTLAKIAAYYYGDQSKWHEIAQLNKIRDPNHLKVGRVIKLPQLGGPSPTSQSTQKRSSH